MVISAGSGQPFSHFWVTVLANTDSRFLRQHLWTTGRFEGRFLCLLEYWHRLSGGCYFTAGIGCDCSSRQTGQQKSLNGIRIPTSDVIRLVFPDHVITLFKGYPMSCKTGVNTETQSTGLATIFLTKSVLPESSIMNRGIVSSNV